MASRSGNLPKMPSAVPVLLRIDPESVDPDELRLENIEVIAELEDGFIIGASADALQTFSQSIEKFVAGGANRIAGIWELIEDNRWRPDHILSPDLYARWGTLRDDEWLTVDVSVACVGTVRVPNAPDRKRYRSEERYQQALERYQARREQAFEEWDELSFQRQQQLTEFVQAYQGEFLSGFYDDGEEPVPNSFACRVRLPGKAIRDLVLNFPFVFEVAEPGEVEQPSGGEAFQEADAPTLDIISPEEDAPAVCVIDSGIQEKHLLLAPAVDELTSRSWVGAPTDTADYVPAGGHGTRVAGCVLYPRAVPKSGVYQAPCWIQNARVLDANNQLPERLFPPELLSKVVNHFYPTGTRIYNHSINRFGPCRTRHMSLWAAAIDRLHWEYDLLFVVSSGNLPRSNPTGSPAYTGIVEHLEAGRRYPEYLLERSCRVADPGQSLQALTVGSIAQTGVRGIYNSFADALEPSSFSRCGPGIWGVIKPEVVEVGGDLVTDGANPPTLSWHPDACPELVRSTIAGGPATARDDVGTSYAAPRVAHIVAAVAKELPEEPAMLYKALVVQSARWPAWASAYPDKSAVIRYIGYGIPDVHRATSNSDHRVTLITRGARRIQAKKVHVYQVPIPESLRHPAKDYEILVEVTLSFRARTRRTRRYPKRYLSTWLSWRTSKLDESPAAFARRLVEDYDVEGVVEEGAGELPWIIHDRSDLGQVQGFRRSMGTVQKDWAIIRSHQLRDAFCIAVIGHAGWDKDPDAYAEYALVVSFEALNRDLELYAPIAAAVKSQVEVETEIVLGP